MEWKKNLELKVWEAEQKKQLLQFLAKVTTLKCHHNKVAFGYPIVVPRRPLLEELGNVTKFVRPKCGTNKHLQKGQQDTIIRDNLFEDIQEQKQI